MFTPHQCGCLASCLTLKTWCAKPSLILADLLMSMDGLGMVMDSRRVIIVLTPERQQAFTACLDHFQLHSWVD